MRVHGYCARCHKVKMVTVKAPIHKVPVGICSDCEERRRRS